MTMSFTFSVDQSFFLQRTVNGSLPSVAAQPGNSNIIVSCFPAWYSHITLQWDIPSSWGNCTFNVYYTYSADSDYVRLNRTPILTPYFKDTSEKEFSRFNNGKYIVEAVLPGTGQRVRSKPTFAEYKRREHVDKIASEIQRREYMLLSKFAGIKSFFFKKRNFGMRCTRCWNETQEKVMDDHCPVCFGTSWEGGYFDPLPLFVQYDASPNSKLKSFHGDMEPNSISGWTIALPEIHADDVIIRTGDFIPYKIVAVTSTELQTRPVRQTMSLTQLSKNDIENKLLEMTEKSNSFTYLGELGGEFNPERFPANLIDLNPNNDPAWSKDMKLTHLPKYDI